MKKIILSIVAIIAIAIIAVGIYAYPLAFSKCDKSSMVYIYPEMNNLALADSLKTRFGDEFSANTITVLDLLDVDIS